MTTIEQINRENYSYILTAVSADMYPLVRYEYFSFMDGQAGVASFYDEVKDLVTEVMFGSPDTPYLTWAKQWDNGKGEDFVTMYGNCMDWFHMDKVRELFESRHHEWKGKEDNESEITNVVADMLRISDDPDALISRAKVRLEEIMKEDKNAKYPRKCCITGKGMSSGWHFEGLGGVEYVKDEDKASDYVKTMLSKDSDLCKDLGLITIEDLVNLSNDRALEIAFNHLGVYYTEWELDEDDTWFDIDGIEYTNCHKCEEETREGDFCDNCATTL